MIKFSKESVKQEIKLNTYKHEFHHDAEGYFCGFNDRMYIRNQNMDLTLPISECIVHLYPTEDSVSETGELYGYADSLIHDVVIYNVLTSEYRVLPNKDNLYVGVPAHVRVFKDTSTMFCVEGAVVVNNIGTVVTVKRWEDNGTEK